MGTFLEKFLLCFVPDGNYGVFFFVAMDSVHYNNIKIFTSNCTYI